MTIRPDVPAAARLMEAARSLRLEAAALRKSFPPRRASGAGAEVDVDADGKLLALRVVDARLVPAGQWAPHLRDLYRAAAGADVDGAAVQDLGPGDTDEVSAGLGPRRFTFPGDIDGDAPPAVVLAQVNERLRSRFAAAEAVSSRIVGLDGIGRSDGDDVMVRVGSLGQLLELRISSRLGGLPEPDSNAHLAQALRAAHDDLRRQSDDELDQEGLRS